MTNAERDVLNAMVDALAAERTTSAMLRQRLSGAACALDEALLNMLAPCESPAGEPWRKHDFGPVGARAAYVLAALQNEGLYKARLSNDEMKRRIDALGWRLEV